MKELYLRYNRMFFTLAALALGALAGANLVIDPYGIYPATAWESLSPYRSTEVSRVAKSKVLKDRQFEIVVLGSSRANGGIDENATAWRGASVFNCGLPAGNMEEFLHSGRLAIEEQDHLRELILFADFFTFNDRRSPLADYPVSFFSPTSNWAEFHLDKLFSESTFSRSRKVLGLWRQKKPARPPGHKMAGQVVKVLRSYRRAPNMYGDYRVTGRSRRQFQELVSLCRNAGVALKVVILPVHASLMETMRHAGLWQVWEDWKRHLVEDMGNLGPVWDFQTYSTFATTRLAKSDDPSRALHWFRDPSHPKTAFCSEILHVIYDQEEAEESIKMSGRLLTPDNVDAWIASVREARERYARECPDELRFVKEALRGL